MSNVLGHTESQEFLDGLPFQPHAPAPPTNASAVYHAQRHFARNPEPKMDPRFFQNPDRVHRDEVIAKLVAANYREDSPGATAAAAARVPLGCDVDAYVNHLVFEQQQTGPPPARSADRLVRDYRDRR